MVKISFLSFPFYYFSLSFFGIFFVSSTLLAQDLQVVIPQQIDQQTDKRAVLVKEVFYSFPFKGKVVDLKAFKKINTSLEIPDSIIVQLPRLTDTADKSLLIGYMKNAADGRDYLVIIIVENYNTNEATFFLDTDFDNDYLNEAAPLVLIGGATPTSVFLEPPKAGKFALTLGIPKRLNLIDQKLKDLDAINKKFKSKIQYKLAIGFSMGVGTGALSYKYDHVGNGYPTWYNVRFSEKALRTMIGYDFPKFRLGVNATFINHYYYTSYYNEQFSEPMGIRTGILTERNIDQHALNRIQIGLTAAYKINLSRFSELQPIITYGRNIYLSDVYFSDNRPRKEKAYHLSPDAFLEYGAQMEFTIGNKKTFLFNVILNQLSWQPDDFVAEIETLNLTTNHTSWKIMLGYRFAL